jgi:hypothetical protein
MAAIMRRRGSTLEKDFGTVCPAVIFLICLYSAFTLTQYDPTQGICARNVSLCYYFRTEGRLNLQLRTVIDTIKFVA